MNESKSAFITGSVIHLRGLREEDIDGPWLGWFNNQRNTWYMANGTWPTSREGHLRFYRHISESRSDLVLAICMNEDNLHVGNLGLHQIDLINRRAELGIILGDPAVQGRGIATEAMTLLMAHGFNRLNLHKIWLRVDEQNSAARAAFQKAGFQDEGILRDELYHHRRWSASIYMGVLEDEFFERFPQFVETGPDISERGRGR